MKVSSSAEKEDTRVLQPFFTHCDPDDPFAVQQMELNQKQLRFWVENLPSDEADFDTSIKAIAARMGMGLSRARNIVLAVRKLKKLPKLLKQALELGHLDLDRVITIDRSTKGMEESHLSELDGYLLKLFTPSCPREVMRQPAAIANRLKALLINIDPDAVQTSIDEKRGVSVKGEVETARLSARLSRDEALEIQELLESTKKKHGLDNDADALMTMVREHTTAKAVLNLVPNEHGNLEMLGAGALTPQQMTYWLGKVQDVRIIHEHIDENSTDRLFDTGPTPGK